MERVIRPDLTVAVERLGALSVAEAAWLRPHAFSPGGAAAGLAARPAPSPSDTVPFVQILRSAGPQRFFAGADPATVAQFRDRLTGLTGDEPGTREPVTLSHDALLRQALGYAATGDRARAEACVAAIGAWIDTHPGGVDADFTRSAEAARRLISWCWTLMLVRDADALSDSVAAQVFAAIGQHADHLHDSLSHYCPPPTQITGKALALLYAACLFKEFDAAPRWRALATRVLVTEMSAQVGADGVQFEQSTCFHAYTADVYLHFLLLAARNGLEVPASVAARAERMFEFLLAIRRPDGSIPAIGDSDGVSLLPLVRRADDDSRGRFAVAAVCFNRRDFAWAAAGEITELAWLMGVAGVRRFDAMRPAPPVMAPSRVFPSGGYAVMRTGWERDAHQMIVDVGPLGCPASSGHGHADLLGIQCAIFGERAIVDPGTHGYGGDSKWRDYFRSTAAHSTVVIDGASQAEPSGPFGWRRHPRVRLREWHSTPDFDFLDAEHDGYTTLPDPVVHRRRVIFVKPGYWILVDDLAGRGRHDVDLTFQFAAADVRLGPHPWARATTPAGPVLWISPFPSAPAQPSLKSGEPSPTRGWIAPQLARLSPAPMLIYTFAVALPWRIVTLLLPDRQGLAAPPAVRPIFDDGGLPHGFVFERPRRMVRFDDRAVLVERD